MAHRSLTHTSSLLRTLPTAVTPAFNPALLRQLSTSLPCLANEPPKEEASTQQPQLKKGGLLNSLLHGSEKAKAQGDTMQSHSTTVGRSKFIHEVQKHKIHSQFVDEYKQLIETYYAKISEHPHFKMRLVGSWEVIIGELDTFVHIWEYEGYAGYDFAAGRIRQHNDYSEFLRKLRPMVQSRTVQICREFAFWPCAGPRDSGGIYEMRSYALRPGTLLEWESEWRRGLEARRKFVEPIGAWFAQVGKLHQVHHMWQYESMQARLEKREQAWQVDTWGKTVSKTVKLCDSMEANVLIPLKFSPLK